MALLEVDNLRLYYSTSKGVVKAVDGVSFDLEEGETLALVGESGCGKSTIAKALIRLWERNVSSVDGEIRFEGRDVLHISDEEFRTQYRWKKIAWVPQASMNSLNPVLTIGEQMIEPLVIHHGVDKDKALMQAMDMLEAVGLPRDTVRRYPHQLSGGMKQRVAIAMALILMPKLVILDEPTSALDVITQANIMNLLKRLRREFKLTYIFITHDLALASELADSVAVMYAGKLVEWGSSDDMYVSPKHPYTVGLMGSVPTLRGEKKLTFMPGEVPSLINPPTGCHFYPRCPYFASRGELKGLCDRDEPPYIDVEHKGVRRHLVSCWLYK
ncbi:dipeptide/oligopeptide/nickel ABC transporter ATP-binding protein [Thermocladium modestius]|uniref:Dipeptide/oligopeptide/nickel ABC transporter ATP-binding protein n=1 Tax=Thermocladium modestius TaxID=62609 RepID=A0A830GVL7_9CREN|nr:ABC transporter ATP-binding protein [Thermocladium modestius]GGP21223.1 dipeptide/oligopeptide/nickel ABC transporter ATP-binding protein [Thermocladium modestius]